MGPMAIAGIAGGMGLLGGLAGAQGQKGSTEYQKILAPESELEKQAGKVAGSSLSEFEKMLGFGPGSQDVQGGTDATRSLAALLQQFSQGGNLPTQQDFSQAQGFTNSIFAPQQQQLQQNFADMQTQGDRAAARMGRGGSDPILMNKLMQEKTRQQGMLDSQKTSFFAQQAQQMPMQRLGFAQQYAQVSSGLASQALANRQALFSMGSQLKQNESSFRAGTASTNVQQSSGGGLGGFITGALGGIGAGTSIAGSFGGKTAAPKDLGPVY